MFVDNAAKKKSHSFSANLLLNPVICNCRGGCFVAESFLFLISRFSFDCSRHLPSMRLNNAYLTSALKYF